MTFSGPASVPAQLALVEQPEPRSMAPASLEQWERILPSLQERELEVLAALCRFLGVSGFAVEHGATGGELAAHAGLNLLSVRPRLTGLHKKGLVERLPMRGSRIRGEARCHPYRPLVPLAAVERALLCVTKTQKEPRKRHFR